MTAAISAHLRTFEDARWDAAARRVDEAQAAVAEAVQMLADVTTDGQAACDAYDAAAASEASALRLYFLAGENARASRRP